MAHLWRCWCGKYYRCDIDHPPRKNICSIGDDNFHENNCPDFVLHGPLRFEVPQKLVFPEIKGEKDKWVTGESLAAIIEANSMKEPITWVTYMVPGDIQVNPEAVRKLELEPFEKESK